MGMFKAVPGVSEGDTVLQDEAGVLSSKEKVGNVAEKQKPKANGQIASLRQNGYKVRVFHHRKYVAPNGDVYFAGIQLPDTELCSKGGLTVVQVTTPNGEAQTGFAKCGPNDPYNKKIGNKIALSRALKELNK